jgi:hypothetical protein
VTEIESQKHPAPDIPAGLILIFAALGSLIAAAHHPVIEARERDELLARIPETAFTNRFVHGTLILCGVALLFAFCRFARRQGIQRTSVLLGLIFFALGTLAMIAAALIDGFLVPEIGTNYLRATGATVDAGFSLLQFCSIAIQLFTKSSLIATSSATLLWSISFARRGTVWAALVGVLVALLQLYILAYGGSPITAHTVVFVVAPQMVWNIIVGLLLISGHL